MSPEDNATSQTLARRAAAERAKLKRPSGSAFDRAHADNELADHSFVNAAVDKQRIPSASNHELRDLPKAGSKIFQGHQQRADHMVEKLARKTTAVTPRLGVRMRQSKTTPRGHPMASVPRK